MDLFTYIYDSALFGFLLFFSIVGVIFLAFYISSKLRENQNIHKAKKISKKLNYLDDDFDYESLIANKILDLHNFKIIIKSLIDMGEYEKSISLIDTIIKHTNEQESITNYLPLMAKVYLKSGAFDKSEKVLLEYLSIKPDNVDALIYLFIKTKDYKKAYDICESLDELQENTKSKKLFLDIQSQKVHKEDYAEIISFIADDKPLLRAFYKFLFFGNLDYLLDKKILDKNAQALIWDLFFEIHDTIQIQNILNKNKTLGGIFVANNSFETSFEKSDIDEINILALAKKEKLDFSPIFHYICDKCDISYSMDSDICPNCFSVFSLGLKTEIINNSKERIDDV